MARLMGAASRQRLTAKLPPQQFHCLLEELPLHLIPRGIERASKAREESDFLFLNPACLILPAGQVPAELEGRQDLLEGFYLQSTIAWVRDPRAGFWLPFWLGPKCEAILSQVQAGEVAAVPHSGTLRDALTKAGILLSASTEERRIAEWKAMVERGVRAFREIHFTVPRYAATTGMRFARERLGWGANRACAAMWLTTNRSRAISIISSRV
jgi:hypothetical protein